MQPAIVLLELESIALGIRVGDAMAKRSPVATLHAGTVHPGRYLVLAGGPVGEVDEARLAGLEAAGSGLLDHLYLPAVHPEVIAALTGTRRPMEGAALGVVETATVATVLTATDAALKAADVTLMELRLADGLGGKGYALFSGELTDLEAALEAAGESPARPGNLLAREIIPRLSEEMRVNLEGGGTFGGRVGLVKQ
jgi:microcompartment protein CcmL/EutN